MMYYSESWAEEVSDEDAEQSVKAYCARIKARRHAKIDKVFAAYQACPPTVQREKLSCKITGS
jgi:hypothetical protein